MARSAAARLFSELVASTAAALREDIAAVDEASAMVKALGDKATADKAAMADEYNINILISLDFEEKIKTLTCCNCRSYYILNKRT